jgi:glutathione S-transferase
MFKLHGSPLSNYYSIVKLILLEKGLDFEEVGRAPSQDAEYLAISPMGKIPALECREGFLSETQVIADFLEDIYPEIALYPSKPFDRALVKRMCHMAEIYIDLPIRPILRAMFSGAQPGQETVQQARQQLVEGLQGLNRVTTPGPWLAGQKFTMADIFAYYILGLAEFVASSYLDLDISSELPGFGPWKTAVAEREFVGQVDAAQQAAQQAFMASQGK